MGWSIGYDHNWKRDIGYGVPARCDHPGCGKFINRGLSYVCGGDPYGGDHGCGLFFCSKHLHFGEHRQQCERCLDGKDPFEPKADLQKWRRWKLQHSSWRQWREENPETVRVLRIALNIPE